MVADLESSTGPHGSMEGRSPPDGLVVIDRSTTNEDGVATSGTPLFAAYVAGVVTALVLITVSSCSYFWPAPSGFGGGSSEAPLLAARSETAEGEPIVRVRLASRSREAIVDGPAEVLVRVRHEPGRLGRFATPLRVRIGERSWRLEDGDGAVDLIERSGAGPGDDALRIISPGARRALLDRDEAASSGADESLRVIDGDGDEYVLPGEVWLHGRGGLGDGVDATAARRAPAFDIVERLPIEAYLPGVIAKELYANWRLETFKAQAVAARSYALHERQRRMARSSHFHLENTTRSQVYQGATGNLTARQAVAETHGEVLTWRGHLLRAYFSSTTGGRAAGAADIWPTGDGFEFNLMPPIQATARDDSDGFSPLYRWSVTRDRASLTRRLRAYAADRGFAMRALTRLARIEPAETNAFGRPTTYRVFDVDGRSWTMNAEHMRLACNFASGDLDRPSRDERVNSSDFTARVSGDVVTIEGRGFGHGVGMSQFGAEGMARRGVSYAEILEHYYPRAELERMY